MKNTPSQLDDVKVTLSNLSDPVNQIKIDDEIAFRSSELFEPDFHVYADRGNNCLKWDDDEQIDKLS